MNRPDLSSALFDAFPSTNFRGNVANHDCDECAALRERLAGSSWTMVTAEFVDENAGALPLLTPEAYVAYLPAWLLRAIEDPDSEGAAMLMVNLQLEPEQVSRFTCEQKKMIVAVAEWVCQKNGYGPEDPVNKEAFESIRVTWSSNAI